MKLLELFDKNLFSDGVNAETVSGKNFRTLAVAYAEGTFHLFYTNNSGKYPRVIFHAVSADAVIWKKAEYALLPSFSDFFGIGSGCTVFRKGKIDLLYTAYTFGGSRIRLCSSRDGYKFDRFPRPLVYANDLAKNKARVNVFPMSVGCPQTVYSDGTLSMIASAHNGKNNTFCLFESPNALNWEYKFTFLEEDGKGTRYKNPCAVRLDDRQFLIYSVISKNKSESVGYRECVFRFASRTVTAKKAFSPLYGLHTPRTAVLPDGRKLLFAALKNGEQYVLATPRELSYNAEGQLLQTPIRELVEYYNDERAETVKTDAFGTDVYGGSGGGSDTSIKAKLTQSKKYELDFICADGFTAATAAFDAQNKEVSFVSAEGEKIAAPFKGGKTVDLRLIIKRDSIEIFTDGGALSLGLAVSGYAGINVKIKTDAPEYVEVKRYGLAFDKGAI